MTTLQIANFSFAYQADGPNILNHITWTPAPNSFNLLVGPSGSGKSTLLKAMAGLAPKFGGVVAGGDILLDNQSIGPIVPFERAKRIAILFQNPSRQFAMQTAREQIAFALENLQFARPVIDDRVATTITEFHLEKIADQNLLTLSGGEQQRVALAVVWAMNADIILLDEPFANVDPAGRVALLTTLQELHQQQAKTIVISDHDWSGYADLATHFFSLSAEAGRLTQRPLTELRDYQPSTVTFADHRQANPTFSWEKLSVAVGPRQLLHDTTGFLSAGQLGLLSGPNGTGKSTFLQALTRQRPYQGVIRYVNQPTERLSRRLLAKHIGLVFQNPTDQFVTMTVAEELSLSHKHSLQAAYWTPGRITAALTTLGLQDLQKQVVYQLSGGQQKKVQTLAMLIMAQPVLLFDEPLAGLDSESSHSLLMLMQQTIRDLGIAGLMISHQRTDLPGFIDYELQLKDQGLVVTGGDSDA
jgi:energy-coupling factor transport system ATP-binding protein